MVNTLTIGTKIKPANIHNTPALMGDFKIGGKILGKIMLVSITTTENKKLTHTETAVVLFQNNPYKNGAKKAPAKAPQEIPIN